MKTTYDKGNIIISPETDFETQMLKSFAIGTVYHTENYEGGEVGIKIEAYEE